MKVSDSNHMASIDLMRGFTLFLMLFVNDLYVPGVPHWLAHTAAEEDGMGLADWVFPGFLFMVGLSIPFAFQSRLEAGHSKPVLIRHILVRSFSLLLIGVMMVNVGRYSEELSGLPKNLWAILMYISVFLIWNRYPDKTKIYLILRGLGIVGLAGLALIFRSGDPESPWLQTSWWGILGLIGWGYLAASLSYLASNGKPRILAVFVSIFLLLNILGSAKLLPLPGLLSSVCGVILRGNTPFLVCSGVLAGIFLKKNTNRPALFRFLFIAGLICLAAGFLLRNWFIVSKIQATPSWGFLCTGISLLVFSVIYLFFEKRADIKVLEPFRLAGQNSLTTYLAPDIVYYLLWSLPFQVLLYKQDQSALLAVSGSLVWSLAMIYLVKALSRIPVKLKL